MSEVSHVSGENDTLKSQNMRIRKFDIKEVHFFCLLHSWANFGVLVADASDFAFDL